MPTSSPRRTLVLLLLLPTAARASLPATVSATVYTPGDHVSSVHIPTLGGGGLDPSNSSVQPLVIAALDARDPFFRFASNDQGSLDDFLLLGPDGNARFLFSSWGSDGVGEVGRLRARIDARLEALSVADKWAGRLIYTNGTAEEALGVEITGALTQWGSPRNTISVGHGSTIVSVPRLDCRYTFCPWPSQNQDIQLAKAENVCSPQKYNFSSASAVLVLMSPDANCSAEQAALANIAAGADGVVVAAADARDLVYPLGVRAAAGNQGLAKWATMVSFEDGAKLAAVLSPASEDDPTPGSFSTKTGRGQALAIDASGTFQQVGWEKYATLRQIGWEAQWLGYKADLINHVAKPAFTIPVFDRAVTSSTSSIIICSIVSCWPACFACAQTCIP